MESLTTTVTIPCPIHPSKLIQKIDSRPNAAKTLYCSDCITNNKSPETLISNLMSLEEFISSASVFYSSCLSRTPTYSDTPPELMEAFSVQEETMMRVTKQIDKQKKLIDDIFEEITRVTLKKINEKKNLYLDSLNRQIKDVRNRYSHFKKEVTKSFPKPEDFEFIFPSKQELDKRLSEVKDTSQLSSFIEEIRIDMNQDKHNAANKKYLSGLAKDLKELREQQPIVLANSLDFDALVASIQEGLDQFLQKTLVLPTTVTYNEKSVLSDLISSEDFKQIKEWIPAKYKFHLNLIYKSSRDGYTAKAFHSKCDGKGPTITIIKCKFKGENQTSVIGGFLDQRWNPEKEWITSSEAFIFSLTDKVKCEVKDQQKAASGFAKKLFAFGQDLVVNESGNCYILPYYYNNRKLVEGKSQNYKHFFVVKDIEVYELLQ